MKLTWKKIKKYLSRLRAFAANENPPEWDDENGCPKAEEDFSTKQVIVMRKYFANEKNSQCQIRRGKEIAQGSHASMAFISKPLASGGIIKLTKVEKNWLKNSFKKVVLQVDNEEELISVHEAAIKEGIKSYLIQDSGLTEFNGVPTYTCCAIGPDVDEKIDKVTGKLKLY